MRDALRPRLADAAGNWTADYVRLRFAATRDGVARMKIADRLTEDLRTALDAEHVEVEDESARHRGHAGALGGRPLRRRHRVARFEGLDPVERHRAVYAALGDLRERRVHALALRTYTPKSGGGS